MALLKLLKGMATAKDGAVQLRCHKRLLAKALLQLLKKGIATAKDGAVAAAKKVIAAAKGGAVAAKDGWQWCCCSC